MKIYKTKTGERIDAKEFFKRFKKGIDSITPLQKLQNEQRATFIMLVGYLVGLISLVIYREAFVVAWFTYALIIIFFGALFGQVIKYLTLRSQLKLFKDLGDESLDLNKIMESLETEKIEKDVEKSFVGGSMFKPVEEVKPIILDDNELSISCYAEEYPENWKKINEEVTLVDGERKGMSSTTMKAEDYVDTDERRLKEDENNI